MSDFEDAGYRVVKSIVFEDSYYWIKECIGHYSEEYFKSEEDAIKNWEAGQFQGTNK